MKPALVQTRALGKNIYYTKLLFSASLSFQYSQAVIGCMFGLILFFTVRGVLYVKLFEEVDG